MDMQHDRTIQSSRAVIELSLACLLALLSVHLCRYFLA